MPLLLSSPAVEMVLLQVESSRVPACKIVSCSESRDVVSLCSCCAFISTCFVIKARLRLTCSAPAGVLSSW